MVFVWNPREGLLFSLQIKKKQKTKVVHAVMVMVIV
jgi:hypothetical protein